MSTKIICYNMEKIRVAAELWIATALLHRQYPNRDDFTVREIVQQAEAKRLTGGPLRPGVQVFAYLHGVANKAPNPGRDRILVETSKGRRRLFRPGDPYHPRRGGKGIPRADEIPAQYAELIHWYRREYVGEIDQVTTDPILSLRGLGKAIWADEGSRCLRPPDSRGVGMSRVFWDTNLFVYLVEDKGTRADQVVALRQWMIERKDELLTSALTLGEVLVKPIEAGDEELRRRYEHAIGASATVLPFDAPVAPIFADIRRDRSIRAPDAIQLACASAAGTDLFITNDDRLSKKNIRGIQFIQSLEKATP